MYKFKVILKRILGYLNLDGGVKKLYDSEDFIEAYSKHTDLRVSQNPQEAIGGQWDFIGELQYNFLIEQGLVPSSKMLDIGCGTLRGGQHFIKYLNQGNYTGIDISQNIINTAKETVIDCQELEVKKPRIIFNESKDLKFSIFNDETFDFILAQSVFTHLMPEHIEECFVNIKKVMDSNSIFYFTIFESNKYERLDYKDFSYPISYFEQLCVKQGFKLSIFKDKYKHPRSQTMLGIQKTS